VPATVVAIALVLAGCDDDEPTAGTAGVEQSRIEERHATKVTITNDRHPPDVFVHGTVESAESECEVGRNVSVYRHEPGADRLLRTFRSEPLGTKGAWRDYLHQARIGWQLYAVARAARRDELACLRDRSPLHRVQGSVP
jgi:hypothetical protein